MLRTLLIFVFSAFIMLPVQAQTAQETAKDLGETAGQIAGDIANRSAEFLRKKGPELVQKGQEGLNTVLKQTGPAWQEVKLIAANLRDYNAYCDKDSGPFRDSALCISLRPDPPKRAPIITMLNGLAQTSGLDESGKANASTVLSWRLEDALSLEVGAGNTVSAIVHQIYRNISECLGANGGCASVQAEDHQFVIVLKDIVLHTEATFGNSNNDTAQAAQKIKTAYGF